MSYLTEQEQIEIFIRWWKENGPMTLIAAALVLAAYVGWTQWQAHQHGRAEAASVIYEQLLQSADDPSSHVTDLATRLHEEYSDTFYGRAALLFLARDAVEKKDLESAEKYLDSLIQENPGDDLVYTARLRSARVLHDLGKDDEALARLQEPVASGFKSLYAELRGDIYREQNQLDKARSAYEEAKAANEAGAGSPSEILEMKLSQVGLNP